MIIYRFINKGSHRIIHRYHLSSSSICRMRIDRNEFAGGRRQLSTSYGKSKSNTNSICRMRIDRNEFAGGRRQLSTSYGKSKSNTNEDGGMYIVKAGLPLFLFCFLGVFVVSSGIEGKNAERDAFQGRISKSKRQAVMDKEHDDMMDKFSKIVKEDDFDNTKRIERPDEVLERRRKERVARNRWYKKAWSYVQGGQ